MEQSKLTELKKGEPLEEKLQFLLHQGVCLQRIHPGRQAGEMDISAYYCDVLLRLRGNVRRLRIELWRQKNWLLHHVTAPSHFFFGRKLLAQNDMTVVLRSPY
jgi:hypothetical protein